MTPAPCSHPLPDLIVDGPATGKASCPLCGADASFHVTYGPWTAVCAGPLLDDIWDMS